MGHLCSNFSALIISIVSRQVTIFLLPKIFSAAIKKSDKFAQIELKSRNSIGTAILGLFFEIIRTDAKDGFSGTIILWCFVIAKLIFLVFIIRAALKMVDGITML